MFNQQEIQQQCKNNAVSPGSNVSSGGLQLNFPPRTTGHQNEVYRSMPVFQQPANTAQDISPPIARKATPPGTGLNSNKLPTPRQVTAPQLCVNLETYGLESGFWCGTENKDVHAVSYIVSDTLQCKGIDFQMNATKYKFKCVASLDGLMVSFTVRIFSMNDIDRASPVLGDMNPFHLIVVQEPCSNCTMVQRPFILQLFAKAIVAGDFLVNFQLPRDSSRICRQPFAENRWGTVGTPLTMSPGHDQVSSNPETVDNGITHLLDTALNSPYLDSQLQALDSLVRLTCTSRAVRESMRRMGSLKLLVALCGPPESEANPPTAYSEGLNQCRQSAVTIVANVITSENATFADSQSFIYTDQQQSKVATLQNASIEQSTTSVMHSSNMAVSYSRTPPTMYPVTLNTNQVISNSNMESNSVKQQQEQQGECSRDPFTETDDPHISTDDRGSPPYPPEVAAVLTAAFLAVVDSQCYRAREFKRQACRAVSGMICAYPLQYVSDTRGSLPAIIAAMHRCVGCQADGRLELFAIRALETFRSFHNERSIMRSVHG